MRIDNQHRLPIIALLCALSSGCSAHASFRAGAGSYGENSTRPVASGAEQPPPSSSTPSSSHADAAQPARASDQGLQQVSAAPATAPTVATPVNTPQQIAQAPHVQPGSTPPQGDHNRGHGNDADGHDEDNPGRKHGKRSAQGGDHDRGHGNDADGVDEQNPGKSKKKK